MWCNNYEFFKGKFSSGATPLLKNKKLKPKAQEKKKKNVNFEKMYKKKPIAKKSGFSKFKVDLIEGEDTKSVQENNFEEINESLRTPSPKIKKKNLDFFTISLKKFKNSNLTNPNFDLETTTQTSEFLDDSADFLKKRKENAYEISDKSQSSSNKSRFEHDYEIVEVIGKGYFGTVYKCVNKVDGLFYAVKCTNFNIRCINSEKKILFMYIFN